MRHRIPITCQLSASTRTSVILCNHTDLAHLPCAVDELETSREYERPVVLSCGSTHRLKLLPVVRSHLLKGLLVQVVEAVVATLVHQIVDKGLEILVRFDELVTCVLDIGLHIGATVYKLLETSSTLYII